MNELQPLPIDVVSVQSQVVYGSVGNSVAVPALRSLGLRVAAVPTVLLSNTPHYPTLHGGPVPTAWFKGYLDGLLERSALRHCRALLIGYLGGPEQAALLADWIERVTKAHPALMVQLDPVIGDHESGTYVDPRLVEAFRDRLLPMAHGLTPNAYELEQLSGRRLPDLEATFEAARALLGGRTGWVAVTSARNPDDGPDQMSVAVVTPDGDQVVSHRHVASSAKGTGDLFAAVTAARTLAGDPLERAVRSACDTVVEALERTRDAHMAELLL